MTLDKNMQPLAVGDKVTIEGEVTELYGGGVEVVILYPRKEKGPTITINPGATEKVG